jgi:hypothetical protein
MMPCLDLHYASIAASDGLELRLKKGAETEASAPLLDRLRLA